MSNYSAHALKIYEITQQYVVRLVDDDQEILDQYLHYTKTHEPPQTLERLYLRLLESAQNANSKPRVIGDAIGGVESLGKVLYAFQPQAVLKRYSGWEELLDTVIEELNPRGEIRRAPKSLWPHFCRTVLSSAAFMVQFSSAQEFYQWADFFAKDAHARAALPLILSEEIHGIGFALACDFLKEIGYTQFGKPDVHIKAIFTTLSLCDPKARDYQISKAIDKFANAVGAEPYTVDKLFWLAATGDCYDHPLIAIATKKNTSRTKFLDYVQEQLS